MDSEPCYRNVLRRISPEINDVRSSTTREDRAVTTLRVWLTVFGLASCTLLLQGCGALQGCPDRTTICKLI